MDFWKAAQTRQQIICGVNARRQIRLIWRNVDESHYRVEQGAITRLASVWRAFMSNFGFVITNEVSGKKNLLFC